MAEAVSGGIGGITGALQGTLNDFGGRVQQWVDNIFPPEKRNQAVGFLAQFASNKPGLAVRLLSLSITLPKCPTQNVKNQRANGIVKF